MNVKNYVKHRRKNNIYSIQRKNKCGDLSILLITEIHSGLIFKSGNSIQLKIVFWLKSKKKCHNNPGKFFLNRPQEAITKGGKNIVK